MEGLLLYNQEILNVSPPTNPTINEIGNFIINVANVLPLIADKTANISINTINS